MSPLSLAYPDELSLGVRWWRGGGPRGGWGARRRCGVEVVVDVALMLLGTCHGGGAR